MNANAKSIALPSDLKHNGKTYKIPAANIEHFIQFESWLEGQLWAAHRRSRNKIPQEEYDRNSTQLIALLGGGDYNYPQPAYMKALFTLSGMKAFVSILFRDTYPELDEETVHKMVQERYESFVSILAEQQKADFTTGTKE